MHLSWTKTYTEAEPCRINKWLAQSGVCSRREADALIAAGQVSIDDQVVREAGRKIEKGETLSLAGAAQDKLNTQITAVLNKPVGYVSAQPEPGQTPAARLVTKANLVGDAPSIPTRDTRLAPAGRLDQDSRGLLLLTEDGVLTKAVIGASSNVDKEYLVTVNGKITPDKVNRLCHGLSLDGKKLQPAEVSHESGQLLRFILKEGRKRQIRRMCELVGLHVTDLFRIRIGAVNLDDLKEGAWRALSDAERAKLIKLGGEEKRTLKPPHRTKSKTAPRSPRRPRRSGAQTKK